MARPKKEANIFDNVDNDYNPDDNIFKDLSKVEQKELSVDDIAAVMLDNDELEIDDSDDSDDIVDTDFICGICHMSCHSGLFDHKDKKLGSICVNCS